MVSSSSALSACYNHSRLHGPSLGSFQFFWFFSIVRGIFRGVFWAQNRFLTRFRAQNAQKKYNNTSTVVFSQEENRNLRGSLMFSVFSRTMVMKDIASAQMYRKHLVRQRKTCPAILTMTGKNST